MAMRLPEYMQNQRWGFSILSWLLVLMIIAVILPMCRLLRSCWKKVYLIYYNPLHISIYERTASQGAVFFFPHTYSHGNYSDLQRRWNKHPTLQEVWEYFLWSEQYGQGAVQCSQQSSFLGYINCQDSVNCGWWQDLFRFRYKQLPFQYFKWCGFQRYRYKHRPLQNLQESLVSRDGI